MDTTLHGKTTLQDLEEHRNIAPAGGLSADIARRRRPIHLEA